MMTECSGKDGWNAYRGCGNPTVLFIDTNIFKLIEIFNLETKYRLSEYYQKAYSLKDSLDWAEKVTNALQIRCLKECDIEPTTESLDMLHSSRTYISDYSNTIKDSLDLLTIPQKYDHSRKGYLDVNNNTPEGTEVHDLEMKKHKLNDILTSLEAGNNLPTVIIAGSMS